MKNFSHLFVILLIVLAGNVTMAEESNLSKPFDWTVGDWVAYCLSQDVRVKIENQQAKYQDPAASASVITKYDREKEIIIVEIYGGRNKIEKGKSSINYWLSYIRNFHIKRVSTQYNISLNENDYKIIYYNRETGKEIIRLEKEQFLLPKD
ncbi:MAG TPA: hypothetical protein VMX17_15955 [Candidatus Glassbacteria bacterium]|nr:hypothetical protein [Candidatus Glassbacteria bacterium]